MAVILTKMTQLFRSFAKNVGQWPLNDQQNKLAILWTYPRYAEGLEPEL